MDDEHQLRRRAEVVRQLIGDMWGDGAPPGPDPQMALLLDTLMGDEQDGRAEQVVVRGDCLTYRQLIEAVAGCGEPSARFAGLPPALVRRLSASSTFPPTPVSRGMAALPARHAGAWELDSSNGVLSYDSITARLLGVGHTDGWCELHPVGMAAIHPDDHFVVESAITESLSTGRPYQARFRALLPHGDYGWRASHARPVAGIRSDVVRLIGFVADDD